MPVPLGLVGTTINPMHNHQVLCYGYDDHANGTTTLYLYDNNAPDTESTIKLDFTQPALHGDESCPKDERGPLRGLFCTVYSPHTPPKAVVLHSGLIISPPNGDSNKPMAVDFSAANIGYGKSLMLQLIAAADAGQLAVSAPSALEESQSLPFKSSLTFKSPGDHQVRALVKVINEQKNIETIKQLPPEGTSQTPIAHLKIFAPRNIRAVTQSGCEKTNIAGSKVTFVVNATDMGANPQFLWKVDGATIEGSANQRQIEVQLPATETTVTLQVTVSLPDGSFSMGSSSFLTILPLAAAIQQNLCEMGHRMIQPPYMYDFRNSEPFPEATTRITFQDLAAMHKVANSIVTSLTAAMRIEAPLTFAPGIRSILADQIVEGHAKAAGVGMNTPPVPGEV